MYTLTVSATPGGHVDRPGQGYFHYAEGATVSISAVASTGYQFLGWTGGGVNAGRVASPISASTTVEINADYSLLANFEAGERSRLTLSVGLAVTW